MKKRNMPLRYKTAIMILPIGVVIGTAVFMWMYYEKHHEKKNEQGVIAASAIRLSDLNDMIVKFTELIGPRDLETEAGRVGLRRAAVMIEGRLGPQNVGFQVRKGAGEVAHGLLWKSLWVDVRGEGKEDEIVVVAVSYAGEGKSGDSNAVSALMMVASSLARSEVARTIRCVFLPYDIAPAEQDSWIKKQCIEPGETLTRIVGLSSLPVSVAESVPDGWMVVDSDGKSGWQGLVEGRGSIPPPSQDGVWLTHFVFMNGNFENGHQQRTAATIAVAEQLRSWLLLMANE